MCILRFKKKAASIWEPYRIIPNELLGTYYKKKLQKEGSYLVFVLKIFSVICFNSRMFDLKYINSENYLILHNKIIHWSLIYWFVSMKKKTKIFWINTQLVGHFTFRKYSSLIKSLIEYLFILCIYIVSFSFSFYIGWLRFISRGYRQLGDLNIWGSSRSFMYDDRVFFFTSNT